ncbi:MAG: EAL domain-containing protein [Solirubrobacteraceae bacterium]
MEMHRAGEPSRPQKTGEAIAPLRGLLELVRLTRQQTDLLQTLRVVAGTVSESLGFATVVINVFHPERDEYEVVAVQGSDHARQLLMGQVSGADTWTPYLNPRFLRHGAYWVPEGSLTHEPSVTWYTPAVAPDGPADESHWHPDDALFATLEGAGGRRYGVISVDDPASGLRPADEQLEVLGALAAHASLAIESSRQVAALQGALARNRAVIASTLEAVIAVDREDRLIEFNNAAERAFDYRAEDVLGRDVADLLIPAAGREVYRRNARRVRQNPDSSLLDRRIETLGMRSDGSEFPVELTVTRVENTEPEGPVFYAFLRDIAERRRSEEQLAYLAYHDALTGLPNRSMVEQQLDLALARARRAGQAVALMFVDLDDFKEVNDRLGHAAGDRLLAAVSNRLRGVLRDSDVLARQGGDEFLVLLADLADNPATAAEHVGMKLLDTLREPYVVAGTEVRTGASIGISLYPDDAEDTEALLRHADAAMYAAKGDGGGRLSFHQRSDKLSSRRTSVSAQLRSAIDQGELELHYQPVWGLEGAREISVAEALVRWRHPERGLLAPGSFINLADQSSAGDELMSWVIAEACRHARAWRADGLEPLIAVNVSSHQLLAPEFATRFGDQVRSCGLEPSAFAVELTESAWTVDSAEALEVVEALRAAGFGLALDDFGAGYSSLSRLVDLGFDAIKLDGRLLAGVPEDPTAVELLHAVIGLAAVCGSHIVAEGIETAAQLAFLREAGITHGQGYHLGGPMSAAELTDLLRRETIRPPTLHRPQPVRPTES